MHKSRFTDSQILAMLKQNEEGAAVSHICREHSISQAQFYIYEMLPYCKNPSESIVDCKHLSGVSRD